MVQLFGNACAAHIFGLEGKYSLPKKKLQKRNRTDRCSTLIVATVASGKKPPKHVRSLAMRLPPPPSPPPPASYLEFERVFRPMFVVLWRPILEREGSEGGSNSHGTDRGGRRREEEKKGKEAEK